MRKPSRGHGQMLALQVAILVCMAMSPAVLGIVTDEECKCFMCVCDVDPHPLPPEVPSSHHPPPPTEPQPVPSPPPPALPAYYPPPGYYYYPPLPYGYPWQGYPTYGPPAGEMYPRDKASKSGAARRGGHGRSALIVGAVLASAALTLLVVRSA